MSASNLDDPIKSEAIPSKNTASNAALFSKQFGVSKAGSWYTVVEGTTTDLSNLYPESGPGPGTSRDLSLHISKSATETQQNPTDFRCIMGIQTNPLNRQDHIM